MGFTKPTAMASSRDYRKPRNKELRDLTQNLPHPLRIRDLNGRIVWQNRAAEDASERTSWNPYPVQWQNDKATLEVALERNGAELAGEKEKLAQDLQRLKKQQRATARKKRQAEAAQGRAETALEAARKNEARLQERLQQLERENAELREREEPAGLRRRLQELERVEAEFREFKQRVEEEDAERQLEAQLAEKVAEYERLERTLEEEQKAFELEKHELQRKLRDQEEEFLELKEGFESKSREQKAVPLERIEELRGELEQARAEIKAAERRERRLNEKLESLTELREEHAAVLSSLKEDLAESRERERELKQTLKLYSELREETKELRQQVAELRASEGKLKQDVLVAAEELARYKTGKAAASGAAAGLSVAARNELEFLKKRLAATEKKLDAAHAELRTEKAQNQSVKESERLAFQDSLTGLPNRNMIDRYLQYAHNQSRSSGRSIGFFMIDVDGFRVLNSAYGRDWGDALLKAVGERLNGMRGNTHLVARHSQDRFLLLAADLERGTAAQFLEQASRSLLEALAYPFEVEGEAVKLTGSIGACLGPLPGDNSRDLYELAQYALDAAKSRGSGGYAVFDEGLKQRMQREATYKKQMAHAVEKDEFKAVFQPVYNLRKGQVLGLELLTRWEHRDQKELKPSEFLEPAIQSGLIFGITERVWPRAFRMLRRWQQLRRGLTLSINLCDKELLSPILLNRVREWVAEAGIDPATVLFEVRDQSSLRMSSGWWRILQEYAQAGFGLCLDDYGSDASIFGTLAFHGFKQAKVRVDERAPYLLPSAQAGKRVEYGAKGIQTKFDKKGLVRAGFDMAQGFAVSRPLEVSEIEGVLG